MLKWSSIILLVISCQSLADGMVVDKVYHPYVTVNEREFEWRFMSSQTDQSNVLAQRFGYGHSFYENVAFEVYLVGERDETGDFQLSAYEFETRWMITEQGKYWADWGAVFEIEKQKSVNNYEASVGVIFEKEIGITSLTMNLFAIREWGQTIESEWETEFRLQYRYRYIPELQPSIELYSGEDFVGIGPGFMGVYRIEGQKQIKWEAGFITEVANSGKNHTLRFAIEYEF
ncbi:hypothetical protein KJ365_00295 [Glaciecola sp. XM2]|uniref:hypothetical protein n=1 Tax=Glaciecola sp. XM2 TaxID=1914931 RepID=UPI001BDE89B2|nr:hypothetical protein [Glaciecola sp. XM2]MBT1449304.1 hypothetical protein [Glaciecola sp. XM2]